MIVVWVFLNLVVRMTLCFHDMQHYGPSRSRMTILRRYSSEYSLSSRSASCYTSMTSNSVSLFCKCTPDDTSDDSHRDSVALKSMFGFTESMVILSNIFNLSPKSKPTAKPKEEVTMAAGRRFTTATARTQYVAEQIKEEYQKLFWATGNMNMELWTDDCTFADPFSSFTGPGSTVRFKRNADTLGRLLINPKLSITSFEIESSKGNGNSTKDVVKVGWIFQSKLKLPWKPVLAASGETSHFLDPDTGLICKYEERWKSKTWDVVKRLLVPTKDADA